MGGDVESYDRSSVEKTGGGGALGGGGGALEG
jgi:hypothetical protein